MVKAIIIGLLAAAVLGGGAYLVFHKSSPSQASQMTTTPAQSTKPATSSPAATTPSTAAPSAPASSSQPSSNSSSTPAYNY